MRVPVNTDIIEILEAAQARGVYVAIHHFPAEGIYSSAWWNVEFKVESNGCEAKVEWHNRESGPQAKASSADLITSAWRAFNSLVQHGQPSMLAPRLSHEEIKTLTDARGTTDEAELPPEAPKVGLSFDN